MIRLIIYWTCSRSEKQKIRERFGIENYMNINGETPCSIREEDMPLLMQCQQRGFLKIRTKHGK